MEKKMNDQIISLSADEIKVFKLYQKQENLNNELMNKIDEKIQLRNKIEGDYLSSNWLPMCLLELCGIIAFFSMNNSLLYLPLLFGGATIGVTNMFFERKLDKESSTEGKTKLISNKMKNGGSRELLILILSLALVIPCAMVNPALALCGFGVTLSSCIKGLISYFSRDVYKRFDEKINAISEQENSLKSEHEKAKEDLNKTLLQMTVKVNQKDVEKQTESTTSHDPIQAVHQYQYELDDAKLEQILQTIQELGRQKKIHR